MNGSKPDPFRQAQLQGFRSCSARAVYCCRARPAAAESSLSFRLFFSAAGNSEIVSTSLDMKKALPFAHYRAAALDLAFERCVKIKRRWSRAVVAILFSLESAAAGIDRYSSLIVADPPNQRLKPASVRVTYLGTNGYQLEANGHALWVDPYFTRISLTRAAFNFPIGPNPQRIDEALAHLNGKPDAILVTHGHFDHLLDASVLITRSKARLVGSATAVNLAMRAGVPKNRCEPVKRGDATRIGPWRITALPASHDRLLFMGVPFNRQISGTAPPRRPADWVCGEPLSYLVVANGFRIFIDSGGTPAVLPPSNIGSVDLAILGMALPDSRARFAATVMRLRPRYVLPSHQDNFFLPLGRGFRFAPLTDFPFVRREHQNRRLPGELILVDYFRPWTIPPG
jgi:Predicted Zn-dependent hydrolases of the beta-lactamase fold